MNEDRVVAEPVAWRFHKPGGAPFVGICKIEWPYTVEPLYLAPPNSAPSGEAVREALKTARSEFIRAGYDEESRIVKLLDAALTAPGASVTYESAIEPNYVVETYKSIDRNLGASVGEDRKAHYDHMWKVFGWDQPSDPTPQDAKADAGEIWSDFVSLCEHYENEAEQKIEAGFTGDKAEHEHGFWRGQQITAKSIRRSIPHPKYNRTLPPSTSKPVTIDEIAPTEAQTNSACMSFRHDFGLLSQQQRREVRFTALEWLRAWRKEGFLINARTSGVEWQPIETAPRDGTPVLCFRPDIEFSPITGMDVLWFEPSEGMWLYDGQPVLKQPTHWMPLPAPPAHGGEHETE